MDTDDTLGSISKIQIFEDDKGKYFGIELMYIMEVVSQ